MTNLLQLVLATMLVLGTQTAYASSASSESSATIDSLVLVRLGKAPTYEQYSNHDLLTASVGLDASLCAESGTNISRSHCAELARQEILRRKPVRELLAAVRDADMMSGKGAEAIQLLEQINGPEVESGLRRIAETFTADPGNYLALLHFAEKCQTWSLQTLNRHWFQWGIPSFVWAEAVYEFGHCDYRPATANLISSLDAASGNITDAAEGSLRRMYPDGPKGSLGQAAVKAWNAWIDAHRKS